MYNIILTLHYFHKSFSKLLFFYYKNVCISLLQNLKVNGFIQLGVYYLIISNL